jgi:N-methylhydantoinase B
MNKMDRTRCPPWGLAGGGAALTAGGEVMRASGDRSVLRKGKMEMECDDVVVISSGGGGGHGPAYERAPAHVMNDIAEGYVSVEVAKRDYGVVLGNDGSLDEAATKARRAALSAGKV